MNITPFTSIVFEWRQKPQRQICVARYPLEVGEKMVFFLHKLDEPTLLKRHVAFSLHPHHSVPPQDKHNFQSQNRYKRTRSNRPSERDHCCGGGGLVKQQCTACSLESVRVCVGVFPCLCVCFKVLSLLQDLSVCRTIWLRWLTKGLLCDYILPSLCVSLLHSWHIYTHTPCR